MRYYYYTSKVSRTFNLARIFIILFVVLVLAYSFIISPLLENSNERIVTATVTDKHPSPNSGEYLIFCKDSSGETLVFRNEDSLIKGKFNSSDFYGQIEVGKTYNFTIVGSRVPFLSMYPNIISFAKVHEAID